MNNLRILTVTLTLGLAAPAHAVEPQVADQIAALTGQVAALQREVIALKSMLSRDGSGNVTRTAAGDLLDRVGRNESINIGQSSSRRVGGSSSEAIAADRVAQIGHSDSLAVQRDYTVSVGGQHSHQVAGSATISVAREIVITAGDQLTLKSGTALIRLRKDGSVLISGREIQVLGSGNVIVKGASALTNN